MPDAFRSSIASAAVDEVLSAPDVTLAMRVEQPRGGSAHAYAALMAIPSGVRYTLWHRKLSVQVRAGLRLRVRVRVRP